MHFSPSGPLDESSFGFLLLYPSAPILELAVDLWRFRASATIPRTEWAPGLIDSIRVITAWFCSTLHRLECGPTSCLIHRPKRRRSNAYTLLFGELLDYAEEEHPDSKDKRADDRRSLRWHERGLPFCPFQDPSDLAGSSVDLKLLRKRNR
jgi:hypothetical protein